MLDYSDFSKLIAVVNNEFKIPNKIDYQAIFPAIPDRIDKIYVDEKKKTIAVKWKDGDVTKVKLRKGDKFDIETGAALAILKKVTFSHHHLQKVIEKNLVFVEHKKGKK